MKTKWIKKRAFLISRQSISEIEKYCSQKEIFSCVANLTSNWTKIFYYSRMQFLFILITITHKKQSIFNFICIITTNTTLQQGVRFDPDMPQTIRLEFAKSNTKGKINCNQKSVRTNKWQEWKKWKERTVANKKLSRRYWH